LILFPGAFIAIRRSFIYIFWCVLQMKLFYKVYISLIVLLVLVLGWAGYISYHREEALFNNDMESDALLLGRALSGLTEHAWKKSGPETALALINDANTKEHQAKIRWVWLDQSAAAPYVPHVSLEKLDGVIQGKSISLIVNTLREGAVRFTYVPVNVDREHPGAIEISESLSTLKCYKYNSLLHLLYTTILLLLLSGSLLWYLFHKWIHRPLTRFIEKSRKIGEGDLSANLPVTGHDEFSLLARTLNYMCQKIDATYQTIRVEHEKRIVALEQLRHTERLATVGRISAGMAHELGTPLNVISGRSKMIGSGELKEDEVLECARIIGEQSERITTIMRNLLDFARRRTPHRSSQDIEQMVSRIFEILASTARKADVTLDMVKVGQVPQIAIDTTQMQQVLTNLVLNGIQAMPHGGRLVVELAVEKSRLPDTTQMEKNHIAIRVKDEGEGIKKEDMEHLFEPFFTTKEVGTGTGLGLSIAFGIVEEHGGWIDVISEPGLGSCFTVFLPMEMDQ
jgi:two-component system NtrC family sensor kinase